MRLSVPYISEYGAEALADYLLENGIIVAPCKVGALVWIIDKRFFARNNQRLPLLQCQVDEIASDGKNTYAILNGAEPWFSMRRFKAVNINDFGKTVFRTREGAAAALEGEKNYD